METAAKKLKKKNKATGRDEVSAEMIRYGCRELYKQIASLLNATSGKGDYPEEIRRCILTPLKKILKKDEWVNVRPVILLSVLRKIFTISYSTGWSVLGADEKSYTSKSSSIPER